MVYSLLSEKSICKNVNVRKKKKDKFAYKGEMVKMLTNIGMNKKLRNLSSCVAQLVRPVHKP